MGLLSQRQLTPEEIFTAVVGTALPTVDTIQRRITASSKGLIEVRRKDSELLDSTDVEFLEFPDFCQRHSFCTIHSPVSRRFPLSKQEAADARSDAGA